MARSRKAPSSIRLPDTAAKLLRFIADYSASEGIWPSGVEMCVAIGKRTNNPSYYLEPLIAAGLVAKVRRPTSLSLSPKAQAERVKRGLAYAPARSTGIRNIKVTEAGYAWLQANRPDSEQMSLRLGGTR